jgi:serine/threonine protein kinase
VSDEFEAGMLVGRYQLLFRLGKGGMGEVWAATVNQSQFDFQKQIALKLLRSKDLHTNAATMFRDEAKAASELQHSAIVSTVDLGQDGDILFIAMDMVRGPSLTALLQRLVINKRKMSPGIVAYIGKQISSALHYAHDRAVVDGQKLKLVHRDVSPHNVLLDLNGSIKLTDFGVARTAIQEHLSHVGTVRGKPSYMAPEQVAGADIDARTDVFALGIVLYESSCLKRLFGRSNPVKSMDAVMKHKPRPLTEIDPSFPEPMWLVIEKALKKNPEHRFANAGEMHDALEAASRGLDGATSAPRDLVELIGKNFEPDAFDIDSRVQEILAEVGMKERREVGLPAPTTQDAEPVVQGIQPPMVGTKVAWPSAHAPDPLAPEAIEEARTQFRALTPSASAAMLPAISSDGFTPSGIEMTPVGTHSAYFQPPPARKKWLVPALVLSSAAIVMIGTVAVVLQTRDKAIEQSTAQRVEPPPPPAAAVGVSQKELPPPPPPPPPPVAKADPEPKRAPAPPPKTVTTKRKAPPPPPPPPKKVADATYAEVLDLVTRVKRIDPDKGRAMFPSLIEAGRSNTKELNRLRAEAKSILAKSNGG